MKKNSLLSRIGVSGYNKPKRTPKHPTKSHVVVAKEGSKVKTIRYGSRVYQVQVPTPRQPSKRLVANPSKLDTVRTSPRVRCLPRTGPTRVSGNERSIRKHPCQT